VICPYCLDDVSAKSLEHKDCKIAPGKKFPLAYVKLQGRDDADEPVVFSVVGSVGQGKTVFLCALFDFLDNHLTHIWPGFFSGVLDQESLSRLNENRNLLRNGKLPPPTIQSFPRPGIFRLTNIPQPLKGSLSRLKDTTVLIYDPPGEAFVSDQNISNLASFVRRGSCVLFLIDLSSLGDSIPDKMTELLDTYLLGMVHLAVEQKSQHLIVVYTKSDVLKVFVPEFRTFLEKHPELSDYLNEQRPATLVDPERHLEYLQKVSSLLKEFTMTELRAARFINEANHWFASVSFTAVSSLGAAPEESDGERKLKVEMSPRGVADPLLYVLAKSIQRKKERIPAVPWWERWKNKAVILMGTVIFLAAVTTVYFYGFYNLDFRRAVACQEQKDFQCAILNYSESIRGSPDYAPAYCGRGWAYLSQGNYQKAIEDCDMAVRLQESAEALACRGLSYSARQDLQRALADCNKALSLMPEYAEAFICRASTYLAQRKYADAFKDCEQAILLKPDLTLAYLTRGHVYAATGKSPQALKDFDKALLLEPNRAETYESRGSAYALAGNYDQAIKDLNEAIRLRPQNGSAYIKRGDTYLLSGNHEQAIRDYDKAIELKFNLSETYFKRGNAHIRENAYVGDQGYQQAIEDFDRAILVKPDFVEAYFQRGNTYRNNGKNYEAIQDYDRAIKLQPDYALAFYNRGLAHCQKGDYGQATKDYEDAIKLDSSLGLGSNDSYSDAFYKRGMDFHAKGDNENNKDYDYSLAVKDYTEAIRLNPKSYNAYFKRGSLYFAQQKYDEAINDYTKAIEIDPKSADTYNCRGVAHSRKNERNLAIDDFRAALALNPYSPLFQKNLASLE
jgi:tetratricopeptide (TPR) repeat protein